MVQWIIYGMVYLGSILMVYNIYGFIRFARYIKGLRLRFRDHVILEIPIILLVIFLLGYLAVGFFGHPDLIVAGILFGGSIFVFVIYRLLNGITARILESEEKEAEIRAAEESNRTKAAFLASASHEMRTPMNVILGLCDLELKTQDLQEGTREHLKKIEYSGRHLLGLINNMLDMNNISSGSLEIRKEQFCMEESLAEVNAIAQTLCENKGLTYRFTRGEDVPRCCLGDEIKLRQILLSVLDNAVKYTDSPGSVSFDVKSEAGSGNIRRLTFSISDTGVGIDPDYLPKIFDVFNMADESFTSRYGGGLSLAVTKNIVDLMEGQITAESEKNRGSVFTISIPVEWVECRQPAEEPSAENVSLEGKRILIVEDIPENAEIVMDLLELEDAVTEHAENGQIALDLFKASAPDYYDAVLMDLRMPVMDGFEATRRIRALDRPDADTVPIIALTANAFERDVKASLEAGMNVHLSKPADADELYRTLKQQMALAEKMERGDRV